jgi:hypothetical protein
MDSLRRTAEWNERFDPIVPSEIQWREEANLCGKNLEGQSEDKYEFRV